MPTLTGDFFTRLREAGFINDTPSEVPRYTGPTAPPGDPRARRYAQAALNGEADLVSGAAEGTRNDTLNKAAWKLGQLVESGHLDGQQVIDTLTIAAGKAGLGNAEIARTVPRGIHDGRSKPRIVPEADPIPEAFSIDTNEHPELAEQFTTTVDDQFPRLDWKTLWADETEEDWIVEPLLAAGRSVVLYSPPKVGKSLLMLEVAAGVATGATVLGEDTKQRRVLYVDFENDPRGDIRTRLTSMGYSWEQLDDLVVLSYPTMSALDSEQGGTELLAVAKRWQAEVIIIDTLSRAVAGEENSNDTYLAFYRHTVLKCKQAGIAMIRLDHSGKDAEKGMRGASAKESDVDAVWRMTAIDEIQLSLQCTHKRMQLSDTDLLLIRQSLPHLHHELDQSGRRTKFESKVDAVLAALDARKVPTDAAQRECREALKRTGVAARNDALREAVKRRKTTVSMWDRQT